VAAPTLLRMERAAIAAATQLTYPPQELLLLVYEHLKASGLHGSAALLAKEAALGRGQQQPEGLPALAEGPTPAGRMEPVSGECWAAVRGQLSGTWGGVCRGRLNLVVFSMHDLPGMPSCFAVVSNMCAPGCLQYEVLCLLCCVCCSGQGQVQGPHLWTQPPAACRSSEVRAEAAAGAVSRSWAAAGADH
jgi:hypothetical protein